MTNNGRRQESIRLAQKMELSHLKYFLWRISTGIMYSVHTTRAFFFVQPVGCIAKILIQRQWWTHHFKPTKAFILLAYNFIRLNIEHAIRKRKHSHKTQKKKTDGNNKISSGHVPQQNDFVAFSFGLSFGCLKITKRIRLLKMFMVAHYRSFCVGIWSSSSSQETRLDSCSFEIWHENHE